MKITISMTTYGLALGAVLLATTLPTRGHAYGYVDDRLAETTNTANTKRDAVHVAWFWAVAGTAARGAVVGTAARAAVGVGASAVISRGAMAAPRVAAPYAARPYANNVYNYRPSYQYNYQPRYQPSFAPAVHFPPPRTGHSHGGGNGHASDYGNGAYGSGTYSPQSYVSYQPPQRQCWTTGYETIPVYGGYVTRRHYRCAYH